MSPALAHGSPAQVGYVGEATCLTCHQDQSYAGTRHGHAFEARTPAATRGCESCHGPGQKHAESGDPALIRSFTRLSPSEASETCTTCHNRASHALWDLIPQIAPTYDLQRRLLVDNPMRLYWNAKAYADIPGTTCTTTAACTLTA